MGQQAASFWSWYILVPLFFFFYLLKYQSVRNSWFDSIPPIQSNLMGYRIRSCAWIGKLNFATNTGYSSTGRMKGKKKSQLMLRASCMYWHVDGRSCMWTKVLLSIGELHDGRGTKHERLWHCLTYNGLRSRLQPKLLAIYFLCASYFIIQQGYP